MIIPDVNVLLYATIDAFPAHERARRWWERQLSGDEETGLAPVCALGFVRLATNRRVFTNPMSVADATGCVRSWMEQPHVRVLPGGPQHLDATLALLNATGAAGNLTTDAQIAAHALKHSATIATNDTDFGRFPGLSVVNPVNGASPG